MVELQCPLPRDHSALRDLWHLTHEVAPSRTQSALREFAGTVYNRLECCIAGLHFQDAECGFKAFRQEKSRVVFEQQRTYGFAFDPEILFLAHQRGLRIAEIPVRWAHHPATKVKAFRDGLRMLRDSVAIRWNALVGRYSGPI
jgi:dolichyl-phosphate beta-glucosyltransferase